MLITIYSCKQQNIKKKESSSNKAAIDTNYDYLNFQDSTSFVNAKRGFIATTTDPLIKNSKGETIQNIEGFSFMKNDAPVTANKSLWRQGQLNRIHGLFKVTDGIYQVRGFDLANVTFIEGDSGWIVIDPLTSSESMKKALELVEEHLGKKPIKAILITHTHIDHFGGIGALISDEEFKNNTVDIIAPQGFFENAVSENINAGNAMTRRALYMFGMLIEKSEKGTIGTGLGHFVVRSDHAIYKPTISIDKTGETHTIDGVKMVFQNTPGAEAPSEFMVYFPQKKAFCQSEEINHLMHNLLTLRGTKVRDGLKWSKYIDEAIVMFGNDVEISFGSHHWPTWENENILFFWKKQRDLYRFIHDQTLRLANHGYTPIEIAEMVKLPKSLGSFFGNRGYYGSLSHNIKAQYQLYFGWFDGNPVNLHKLPPTEESIKYVEYMGGAAKVISKAKKDIEKGEYRWVSTALNHVVFADGTNTEAKELLAKVYEQMGYETENATWRNFYLTGAQELRTGLKQKMVSPSGISGSPNMLKQLSLQAYYDFLAIRLNPDKVKGTTYTFNIELPDINKNVVLYLENDVLTPRIGEKATNPTATIIQPKAALDKILINQSTLEKLIETGEIKIKGNKEAYIEFMGMLDTFNLLFPIVEN